MASPQTIKMYEKAKLLVKDGKSVGQACKDLRFNVSSYYAARKIDNTIQPGKKRRKKHAKLTVTDIPVVAINNTRMMLVVGSLQELVEFTKGLQ